VFNSRVLTSALVLAAAVVPASATTIYCDSGCGTDTEAAFNSLIGSLTSNTFIATDLQPGTLQDHEYIDSATMIDFFAFRQSGTSADTFSVNGSNALQTHTSNLDSMEVVLPVDTGAFAANVSVLSSTGSYCIQANTNAGFGTPSCGGDEVTLSTSPFFFGVVSAGPTDPLSTVWIAPVGDPTGSTLVMENFEVGQPPAEASEVATFLMIGTGLFSLGLFRRFRPRAA
jgi:hypothetical protein